MERWTEQKDALLREMYVNQGCAPCAEALGLSKNAVRCRASRLGLRMTGKGGGGCKGWHRWTAEDDEKIRSLYPDNDNRVVAEALGVSVDSIRSRASDLKLAKSETYIRYVRSMAHEWARQASHQRNTEVSRLTKAGYTIVAYWDERTIRDFGIEDAITQQGIRVVPDGCDYKSYKA